MESTSTVIVPTKLYLQGSIDFIKVLNSVQVGQKLTIDFGKHRHINPFSLLYVSIEISKCIKRLGKRNVDLINYQHLTYHAHVGFFKAFKIDFGNKPGQANGSSTYIPIKIYSSQKIIERACKDNCAPAKFLENDCKEIAEKLTMSNSGDLFDNLSYCLREIFRNVLEHSKTDKFGFCAQYRRSINKIAFALIDNGIGLRKSLSFNPHLTLSDDMDAIKNAIRPGISGKSFAGNMFEDYGEWANSGFGLYMTSNICKLGGKFFVASGNAGLSISENATKEYSLDISGTALNLSINTQKIYELNKTLTELSKAAGEAKTKPSKSSLGLN